MVKISPANVGSVGPIPDQGAMIPCALQPKIQKHETVL